jgi:DNA-binding NtrC family response regulator
MAQPETEVIRGSGGGDHLRLPGIKLTVVEGPDRGREAVARRGTVRVGTANDNDLVLTDGAASRRHVELRLHGNDVHAIDVGSTNGTTVDGVRIVEAVLSPGSLVRLGNTAIRISPVDEPVIVPLSSRDRFGGLIGRSHAMREAFAVLERVAPTEATVLIEGETGTGKELAAEGIHLHSSRSEEPFVPFDCGSVAPSLIESELFGHVRGAFTGATGDRKGVLAEADGGTLFLDEIGELPLELQPKLLRALEKREIRPVGSSRSVEIDLRVVAATNRNLSAEVNKGTFREDLFYRLAVVRVKLPPLRMRVEDIPFLVEHFVRRLTPDAPPPSSELVRALASRPWPGNVRELRNAVEHALAMMGSPAPHDEPTIEHIDRDTSLGALLGLPFKEALDQWVESFERAYLEHVLTASGGSVSGAARIAGVNRRYVQRLMKRHGIKSDE